MSSSTIELPSMHVHPASVINPLSRGTTEPVPMGIADFGVTEAGTASSYSSSEFVGRATINAEDMYGHFGAVNDTFISYQLNLNMEVASANSTTFYFVQNVLFMNTTSGEFEFEDAIWNDSGNGTFNSHGIKGNGSIYPFAKQDVYLFEPGPSPSYPGDFAFLSYPTTITAIARTAVAAGVPTLWLQYDDGQGTHTFDTISFPWTMGQSDIGFVVNGTTFAPNGLFQSAEFDCVGTGNGEEVHDISSNISMQLEFWNGHNLQNVPNAYNFGLDTGESMDGAVVALGSSGGTGFPSSTLTQGPGSRARLYGSAEVGFLNLNTTIQSGTIYVNGTAVNYTNGTANITLRSGEYSVQLENGTGIQGTASVTVVAGEVSVVTLPVYYPLTVREHGLPRNTHWAITIDGTTWSTRGTNETIILQSGAHDYEVTAIPGFELATYRGLIRLDQPAVLELNWSSTTYQVNLSELGLPSGSSWWFDILGNNTTLDVPSDTIELTNGTYSFYVGTSLPFSPNASAGSFVVNGSNLIVSFSFTPLPGILRGTIIPSSALLEVNGSAVPIAPDGSYAIFLSPGNYTIEVSEAGDRSYSGHVLILTNTVSWLNVTLTKTPLGTGPSSESSPSFGPSYYFIAGIAIATVLAAVGIALLFRRRR